MSTHVPQLVHFDSSMTGLSHVRFLMKVFQRPAAHGAGAVRTASNSGL